MSLIEKVNSSIFELNEKFAEKFQDKTGLSKDALDDLFFMSSFSLLGINAIKEKDAMQGIGAFSVLILGNQPSRFRSYNSKILFENKFFKYAIPSGYTVSAFFMLDSLSKMVIGSISGDNAMFSEGAGDLPKNIGEFLCLNGLYSSGVDLPPPKRKRYSTLSKMNEKRNLLFPKPTRERNSQYGRLEAF